MKLGNYCYFGSVGVIFEKKLQNLTSGWNKRYNEVMHFFVKCLVLKPALYKEHSIHAAQISYALSIFRTEFSLLDQNLNRFCAIEENIANKDSLI